jgi:hypothetical protein
MFLGLVDRLGITNRLVNRLNLLTGYFNRLNLQNNITFFKKKKKEMNKFIIFGLIASAFSQLQLLK